MSNSINIVVKIQALWRGFRARLISNILKKAMRVKKKYFLDEEFWETVSSTTIYNDKAKPLGKDYTYKCSGAKYTGEWKGGFRYGSGIMQWPDGAIYDGRWMMGRAYGQGKFTHTKGEIYQGEWRHDKA